MGLRIDRLYFTTSDEAETLNNALYEDGLPAYTASSYVITKTNSVDLEIAGLHQFNDEWTLQVDTGRKGAARWLNPPVEVKTDHLERPKSMEVLTVKGRIVLEIKWPGDGHEGGVIC